MSSSGVVSMVGSTPWSSFAVPYSSWMTRSFERTSSITRCRSSAVKTQCIPLGGSTVSAEGSFARFAKISWLRCRMDCLRYTSSSVRWDKAARWAARTPLTFRRSASSSWLALRSASSYLWSFSRSFGSSFACCSELSISPSISARLASEGDFFAWCMAEICASSCWMRSFSLWLCALDALLSCSSSTLSSSCAEYSTCSALFISNSRRFVMCFASVLASLRFSSSCSFLFRFTHSPVLFCPLCLSSSSSFERASICLINASSMTCFSSAACCSATPFSRVISSWICRLMASSWATDSPPSKRIMFTWWSSRCKFMISVAYRLSFTRACSSVISAICCRASFCFFSFFFIFS
eukprot:Sspe_Gene.45491::Locus_22532_Transcript_1_1_Confidence_1.000_Length_1401::g.45491::m.45491